MLGFADASIILWFMGSITSHELDKFLKDPKNEYFGYNFRRKAFIEDVPFEIYENAFVTKNKFGQLHFVGCGSRGIESFQFLQFMSVFEWIFWLSLLVSVVAVAVSITKIYKSHPNSTTFQISALSFHKILLTQRNPFPANFDKVIAIRFAMTGILLAGLVTSNAFKSEDVYKIVLPRKAISYYNIDELIQDNFTLYSRTQTLRYMYVAHIKYASFGKTIKKTEPQISRYGFFLISKIEATSKS